MTVAIEAFKTVDGAVAHSGVSNILARLGKTLSRWTKTATKTGICQRDIPAWMSLLEAIGWKAHKT